MSVGTHSGAPKHPGACGGGPGGSEGSAARPRRVVRADRPDSGRSLVLGLMNMQYHERVLLLLCATVGTI